jgi:phage tail sheath gpL-like
MPIEFQNIPSNWKQPLYWVEVDGSMAGFPESHMAALIVGTMITKAGSPWLGVGTPEVPVLIGRQMDADHLFGQGSELACAMRAYFNNNFANEVWAMPMAETLNASNATGTITVGSAATEAGTVSLYVAGHHIPVNIFTTMTVSDVATELADAINLLPDLPVTAAAAAGVVTLTCKWGAVSGNDITMMDSYYGKIGGDILPVGLTLTYSGFTLSGGVGTPDFTTAIANLGEYEYEFVSLPYTDSNTLLVWEEEYGFVRSPLVEKLALN